MGRILLTFAAKYIAPWIIFVPPISVFIFLASVFMRLVSRWSRKPIFTGRVTPVELITTTLLLAALLWGIFLFSGGYIHAIFILSEKYLPYHAWCSPYSAAACPDESYSEWSKAKIKAYGADWHLAKVEIAIRKLPWSQPEGRCYTQSPGACQLVDESNPQPDRSGAPSWRYAILTIIVSIVIVDSTFKFLRRDKTRVEQAT